MAKVLIVEDDFMIADMTERFLVKSGYEVCGVARSAAEAIAIASADLPDLALVDLRLIDGELGTDVAAQLGALGDIGILYATGNMSQVMQTATVGHACITKPYLPSDLLRGLEIVIEMKATGAAISPFPRGLEVLSQAPPLARPG